MDKFRQTFPIALTFTEGELPTAAKLQGLATQARSGQGLIQYAIGDIWGQGGDAILSASAADRALNSLMIANLGRYMGPSRELNPQVPYLPDILSFTYTFTASDNGKHETKLPFPPDTTVAGYPTAAYVWGTSTNSTTPKTSKALVIAANDWYIDTSTGEIYSYTALATGWTIEYQPAVDGNVDDYATWNIIPDPETDSSFAFFGLKIAYKNGTTNADGYYIYLPPRMPIYPAGSASKPAWYPEPSAANMVTANSTFWQTHTDPADTAVDPEHYRYTLPYCITNSAAWGSGATLPAGLLYLYDPNNTATIIEGVTFAAEVSGTPRKWVLFVPYGTALDTWLASTYGQSAYSDTNLKNTAHTSSLYPATGLRLMTIGADISRTLASLISQFLSHDHSASHSLPAQTVQHSKLSGNIYEGTSPQLVPSGFANDDHPQYLERHGYSTSRDAFGNGILGDLLINSSNSTSNYLNFSADSNKILFNQNSLLNGGAIRTDYTTGKMVVHGRRDGTGGGLLIGDPDSYASSCLELSAYNDSFIIRPFDLAGTLQVGISNASNYLNLRAGDHIDIWVGETPPENCNAGADTISTTSDDDLTIRVEGGIDIRAGQGSVPGNDTTLGAQAGSEEITISCAESLRLYSEEGIYLYADVIYERTPSRTETLVLPLTPMGTTGTPEIFLQSNGNYQFPTGYEGYFAVPSIWPEGLDIASLAVKLKLYTIATNVTVSWYRTSWSANVNYSSTITQIATNAFAVTRITDSATWTECTDSTIAGGTNLRKNNDSIYVHIANSSGTSILVYPNCEITGTTTGNAIWPTQYLA